MTAQTLPGVHHTQHHQLAKRSDYLDVFSAGAASAQVVVKVLECSQRRVIKLVIGQEGMSCEEWLSSLGLCSLEKRSLSGDFIALYSSLQREGEREVLNSSAWDSVIGLLAMVQSCTRRGSDGIRKHFFTGRVVKCWGTVDGTRSWFIGMPYGRD